MSISSVGLQITRDSSGKLLINGRPSERSARDAIKSFLRAPAKVEPNYKESIVNVHDIDVYTVGGGGVISARYMTVYDGALFTNLRYTNGSLVHLQPLDHDYVWRPDSGGIPTLANHPVAKTSSFSINRASERFHTNLTLCTPSAFILDDTHAPLRIWRESDGAYREVWSQVPNLPVCINEDFLKNEDPHIWRCYVNPLDLRVVLNTNMEVKSIGGILDIVVSYCVHPRSFSSSSLGSDSGSGIASTLSSSSSSSSSSSFSSSSSSSSLALSSSSFSVSSSSLSFSVSDILTGLPLRTSELKNATTMSADSLLLENQQGWTCKTCTFFNTTDDLICIICSTLHVREKPTSTAAPPFVKVLKSAMKHKRNYNPTCSACTYQNMEDVTVCAICTSSLLS